MNEPLTPHELQSIDSHARARVADVVLSISAATEDHAALRRILRPISWDVLEAGCCDTAFHLLSAAPVAAVIADDTLPDGDWRHVLAHTLSRSHPAKLIVASRLADESLWAEVLNLGGYDLLAKPFDADEVRRVVSLTRPPQARRIEAARAQPRVAAAVAAA
jgi:DNA-binding response OmpR family regulator